MTVHREKIIRIHIQKQSHVFRGEDGCKGDMVNRRLPPLIPGHCPACQKCRICFNDFKNLFWGSPFHMNMLDGIDSENIDDFPFISGLPDLVFRNVHFRSDFLNRVDGSVLYHWLRNRLRFRESGCGCGCGNRHIAADRFQGFQGKRDVYFIAGLDMNDKVFKGIGCQQQLIDDFGARSRLTFAKPAQNRFQLMGNILDMAKTDKSGATFNGMRGAKNPVYQVRMKHAAGFF